MSRLIFIFILSLSASYSIAAYGHENEWSLQKRILISTVLGIIIGLASQLIN
jgi:L-cystine uptake protein TcyP (sodium:dicarboxylate symporter family)